MGVGVSEMSESRSRGRRRYHRPGGAGEKGSRIWRPSAASWLSKHFTYWWLERQGLGRVLIDSDRL